MGFLTKNLVSSQYTTRATANLPASTAKPLFVVTGRILLTHLLGEVTTVIQTQANATKLTKTTNAGTTTDLCATNDITADAVASYYTITGAPAAAMVNTATTPAIKLTTPVVIDAGTINLSCAATNTGAIKWTLLYSPIEPGAVVQPV
jgi:hypothetical protein